ncbi:MAG: hypothetical protein GY862_07555 [Gammaproteobacteria bacterium]|nr:hypothetical protein [Gammaproteobacteria bacterium]
MASVLLFTTAAPWLAGGAAVGALAGRMSGESANNRAELKRLQTELKRLETEVKRLETEGKRLTATNNTLAERMESLRAASSDKAKTQPDGTDTQSSPRKPAQDPAKVSLLRRILECNLKLRKNIDK